MAIPETVAELIGKPLAKPQIWEVERGAIRRFADAVDDANPLHRNVEYSKNSKYGEMTAPVGFYGWPIKGGGDMEILGKMMGTLMKAGYPIILDGGIEYEPFVPIRAGDILCAYTTVTDISEKTIGSGKGMLLLTLVTDLLNQNGDKALTVRRTAICREL